MNDNRKRKTMPVGDLVDKVNEMLNQSTCSPEVRQGMCAILEHVLMETNNYRGFRYRDDQMTRDSEGRLMVRPGADETRRFYYRDSSL